MRRVLLIAVVPLLLGNGPCSDSPSGGEPREEDGTVGQGVGPECPQTWHIKTADGRMLWPVEDPAFQQEGLQVKFVARERPDKMSFCMAGTIVDLVSIRKK